MRLIFRVLVGVCSGTRIDQHPLLWPSSKEQVLPVRILFKKKTNVKITQNTSWTLLFKSAMPVLIFTVKRMKGSSIAYSLLSAVLACVKVHMELNPSSFSRLIH
jgi:hypothetical protein